MLTVMSYLFILVCFKIFDHLTFLAEHLSLSPEYGRTIDFECCIYVSATIYSRSEYYKLKSEYHCLG